MSAGTWSASWAAERPPESWPVGEHPAPQARCAPDARTKALQLHDLAVVHKEVQLRSVVLHVPGEHRRVGRLEHHLLGPQLRDDPGYHVSAPLANVLRDALGLDHDHVCT